MRFIKSHQSSHHHLSLLLALHAALPESIRPFIDQSDQISSRSPNSSALDPIGQQEQAFNDSHRHEQASLSSFQRLLILCMTTRLNNALQSIDKFIEESIGTTFTEVASYKDINIALEESKSVRVDKTTISISE